MESEERLSTRDIAGGGDTATERDATLADTPPADDAAVPPERADRDDDDGGAVAAGRAGDGNGDVVTDEPSAGRGPSRESVADGTGGTDAGADTADRAAPAAAAAADPGAGDLATRDTAAGDTAADDTAAGDTRAAGSDTAAARTGTATGNTTNGGDGDSAPLLADAEGFQGRWEEIQVRFVDEPRGAVEDADARSWRRHAAPRRGLRPGARAPRGAVGPRRGHLDRGPARRAPALPLVLPPPAVHVATDAAARRASPQTTRCRCRRASAGVALDGVIPSARSAPSCCRRDP